MAIKLLDIYSNNETQTMAEIAAEGYAGIIFKAGQGTWPDVPRVHPEWWQEAKDIGLLRGWYWLPDVRYTGAADQVDEFIEWCGNDFGELGVHADCEYPVLSWWNNPAKYYWPQPYAGWHVYVDFLYLLRQRYASALLGVYTNLGFWNEVLKAMPLAQQEWLARETILWTTQWEVNIPTPYGKWPKWTFWQKQGEPDINVFNGTDEEFHNLFGGISVPPEPPEPPGETMKYKVTVIYPDGATERKSPSTSGVKVKVWSAGSILYAAENEFNPGDGSLWIKLESGNFMATYYPGTNGTRRAKVELIDAPPSSDTVTVTVTTSDGKTGTGIIELK